MIPAKDAPYAALRWWQSLQPDPNRTRSQDRAGDRAALARLRRCGTVADAMQEEATLRLFQAVGATHPRDLEAVGLAAAVLAHVRTDTPGAVARLVGPDSLDKPETAVLKPLRFRRLMEADGLEDRLVAFRRLVGIAGNTLPVRDLADALLLTWSEKRQREWILEYWNAAPPPAALAKDAHP